MNPKPTLPGTIRIKTKDLKPYEKTEKGWKKAKIELTDAMHVIDLFKAHNNFEILIDTKNPQFLRGQLSPDGNPQGARINILPDSRKLDKAYSLFANHLTIHDESSDCHWDVIYQNKGGTYSYVYTLDKKEEAVKKKYKSVERFARCYPQIKSKVISGLRKKDDSLALPMYTLLKTHMRVGNEIYFRAHGHKGLTTLKKSDISIKGNYVTFNYLAKSGVPQTITEKFPASYVKRLSELLKNIKKSSFVFTNNNGHPLRDTDFKKAFKNYCNIEFYPHIVRSYYATSKSREFLRTHKSATKQEVKSFFLGIADKLGHKRFVKKHNAWEDSFNVTIHHYIQPELVDRIKALAM